jgi:hypothetical protein
MKKFEEAKKQQAAMPVQQAAQDVRQTSASATDGRPNIKARAMASKHRSG